MNRLATVEQEKDNFRKNKKEKKEQTKHNKTTFDAAAKQFAPMSTQPRQVLPTSRPGTLLPCVKALVRWATGERLSNRLPKLSLITLSPPLNSGILGLRMGLYVPTPKFFYNLWGPRESDLSDSRHEEIRFSLKSVFMVDVRFELTTNDPWSCRRRHL